ncbi:ABC transporter ATP-binding protein [Pokkaliibacter plantistimulans]|uniref:ABC transporter ATP-binding protein n=1 Tax=Proteobacteria bacterium 228 TaxID=2083153 RepID=A0A2S5KII7_9PROT|nr:ABC transporter ATP-binding protein [Pokkaliibacter plantistimulans]PPC74634.1 ABC transporter ATP-binding protein [Pokkaliibacter plantistimulans]
MIELINVTKFYPTPLGRKYVIRNISAKIPGRRNIGILGRNGAGKSTLLRLLGGIDFPDHGEVKTDQFISWPLGLAAGLHPQMTGREGTRFIARIHGAKNIREIEDFAQDFSELSTDFDLPVRTYSSGMKGRLAFAISMAFDFDTYLLDEVTSVGDPRFKRKAKLALDQKRSSSNVIMVSHSASQLRDFCDCGLVLSDGQLSFFDNINDAISLYETL